MAMIVFNQRYKGRLAQVVPAAKAREIEHFLNNPPDDLTDDQSEFLLAIRKIYPGSQSKPVTAPENVSHEHLTNEGVLQGQSEQIPRGDR